MIGLLYITSRKISFFDIRDIDHIKALSDLIAIVISQIVYSLKKIEDVSIGGNNEK